MGQIGITDHTSRSRGTYSNKWISPDSVLGLSRWLYGPITIDLASSGAANRHVKAARYWTASRPCPRRVPVEVGDHVWCNPPGPCGNVARFWAIWLDCIQRGAKGSFLLFKQDHWRQLSPPHRPMVGLVLRRRQRFVGAAGGANFPSTLVLSDVTTEQRAHLQQHGHPVIWTP